MFLTVLSRTSPTTGPALTVAAHVPDLDHYKGSFGGRVFPLWSDRDGTTSNVRPALLDFLSTEYGKPVSAEDVVAYITAIAAHPAFAARFKPDLATPGLRIPLTTAPSMFDEATELGRTVIWLHTFGERMADPKAGRPAGPPRLPADRRPTVPAGGAISQEPDSMPDVIGYDPDKQRLLIGSGYIDNVEPAVWNYEVSGKQVLRQWFSYRKADRERPLIGDRRAPSPLSDVQPDHWLPEYTTELLNVLNILHWLVDLEPRQAALLDRICSEPTITKDALQAAGVLEPVARQKRSARKKAGPDMFEHANIGL